MTLTKNSNLQEFKIFILVISVGFDVRHAGSKNKFNIEYL